MEREMERRFMRMWKRKHGAAVRQAITARDRGRLRALAGRFRREWDTFCAQGASGLPKPSSV